MADSENWLHGQPAQAAHLTREITPWEPLPQPADLSSTYSSHYQAWPLPPRRRHGKPEDNTRPDSAQPFNTRSTMQDSYQHFAGNHSSKSCRPSTVYAGPTEWMQPISTTHRDTYMNWGVAKRQPFRPASGSSMPLGEFAQTGRSTMQDSFQHHAGHKPTKSAQPVERGIDPTTPFDGTTTSRASYLPWPVQPRIGRKGPSPNLSFMGGGNDGSRMPNSTYRDMFREIQMPHGAPSALGVQVVGGKFYEFFKRGTKAPAMKKVMMTTTQDKQSSIDVVVVLTDDARNFKGRKLGEFELDGIAPSRAGVPQVEVTMNISNDNTLRVTAVDAQGSRNRALTVKEKVRLG